MIKDKTPSSSSSPARAFPRQRLLGGRVVDIDLLGTGDGEAVAGLVQKLPTHDLLFVRRDLAHPKVMSAWLDALGTGTITSLAARWKGELVGCTAVVTDPHGWSRHVAELRVIVSPDWRGRGLGRALIQESFAIALGFGLEKLTVQMTVDQRAAIAVFEELGFRAEALLSRHVADRSGTLHDLVLLSHDVAAVEARNDAYGLTDALGG